MVGRDHKYSNLLTGTNEKTIYEDLFPDKRDQFKVQSSLFTPQHLTLKVPWESVQCNTVKRRLTHNFIELYQGGGGHRRSYDRKWYYYLTIKCSDNVSTPLFYSYPVQSYSVSEDKLQFFW